MALPDIKDVGIVAGFTVWGWPYHGVCEGGMITLPNATTHAMTQPANELTWLIDMGLPAIERSPTELLADADNGFEWRNYALMSGGVVYGKQLNPAHALGTFIHVDEVGSSWAITWTSFDPAVAPYKKSTLHFEIARFGELLVDGEVRPKIYVSVTSNHYSTLRAATYIHSQLYVYPASVYVELEDVWTNGTSALFGFYNAVGAVKDMASLLEISISGDGGVDGSGLVFSGAEIRTMAQMPQIEEVVPPSLKHRILMVPGYVRVCGPQDDPGNYSCWYEESGMQTYEQALGSGGMSSRDGEYYGESFARFAYYKPDGSAVVAKLKIGSKGEWTINSLTLSLSGTDYYPAGGTPELNAHAIYSGSASGWTRTGIYLCEDNVIVDSFSYFQNFSEIRTCDVSYAYDPGGVVYTTNAPLFDAGSWEGDTTTGLPLPTNMNSQGMVSLSAGVAIMDGWRKFRDDSGGITRSASGIDSVTFGAGITLGVQRIAERAAGLFRVDGGVRSYGAIMSPYSATAAGITSTVNIHLTGNRKTGEIATSVNPICYV